MSRSGPTLGQIAWQRCASSAFLHTKRTKNSRTIFPVPRDDLELSLIDHGLIALEDGESDKGEPQLILRCAFNDFGTLQSAIEARGLTPISSESVYAAQTQTEIADEEKANEVMELVAALEGDDDVQNVYTTLA